MINLKDPRQVDLFDRYSELLVPSAYRRLKEGWHGCFRDVILYLLSNPVEKLAEHFSMLGGPETKELFSLAGLMVVKDYFNWSGEEAIDRYNGDLFIQYALNITQGAEISRATYFRYQKLFREDGLGQDVMRTVTDELLKRAKIDTSKQRLDSTHVFSNMAVWSRRKLIHHTIHDFLVQLKRHLRADYDALTDDFRGRYAASNGWCFAKNPPMKTLHYGNTPATPDEQLGYDMRVLLERYAANPAVLNWTKYKVMDQVFSEQFVTDSRAELKKNPGGKILLNPSDPDAEIGHKGAGYQAQIMQTYSEQNQVQMITDILPQGASASDMDSLPVMVGRSVQAGTKPEILLTDAGYGSDYNVCHSKLFDIEQKPTK